jgi:anti-sigma regulatory factor (Ser/Thr protein kinase)
VHTSADGDGRATGHDGPRSPWVWSVSAADAIGATGLRRVFFAYITLHATPESDVEGAVLIFGELVANVVRHAPGALSCHVDWHAVNPTLLVLDEGAGFAVTPITTLGDCGGEGGRGLALVRALAVETVLGNRPEGGAYVSVVLPVRRDMERAQTA